MNKLLLTLLLAASIIPGFAADEKKLQLARDVIKATQADKMFEQMTEQFQQMAAGSTENLSAEDKAKAEKVQKEVVALTMNSVKDLMKRMDAVYADVYTEAELVAMKTFFESEVGRSMLSKQPQLMQKMMPMVMEMQQTLVPQIQAIVEKAGAK